MKPQIDILDELQEVDGYVRLVLSNGETVFGLPQCIVYDEDDEGWETVKTIMFEPWGKRHAVFLVSEDIASYELCGESELPPIE